MKTFIATAVIVLVLLTYVTWGNRSPWATWVWLVFGATMGMWFRYLMGK